MMELLAEIPENYEDEDMQYELRRCARAVLKNDNDDIALLELKSDNYHKLPGGGIEKGETTKETLRREIREEVGAEIRLMGEMGLIIEYRDGYGIYPTGQLQLSYCYLARTRGDLFGRDLTASERGKDQQLKWVDLSRAREIIEQDEPETAMGAYIRARELAILQAAPEKSRGE